MSLIDYIISILFGIVEGITEWIPVSSTGHMILFDQLFHMNVSRDFYDLYQVVIQLGAIMAVVLIFWKEIWPFGVKSEQYKPLSTKGVGQFIKKDKFFLWVKILISCIPAVIVGLKLDDFFDEHFYNPWCVAIALIVFGIWFIKIERSNEQQKVTRNSIGKITYKDALKIGCFQVLAAIFPGTSRSGVTIIGSLLIGIRRDVAAKYSFFLGIPVMFGASILKIAKYKGTVSVSEIMLLLLGMISAFFVSLLVIKKFLSYIRKNSFEVFGWYRIILGAVVLLFFIVGKFVFKVNFTA